VKENELTKCALTHVLDGSNLFSRLNRETDTFFGKYNVADWLSLNQVGTIHEILMLDDKSAILNRLRGYRELQLKRLSEKDKWQKEVDGQKAIDCFCEMVGGLLDRYLSSIKQELEDNFKLMINDSYHPMIYQILISTFDNIFVKKFRTFRGG
jgi:hypothetical protein